jgi:hypothetical protein
MMAWTMEASDAAPVARIIRIEASGSISTDEVMAQAIESIALVKQHGAVGSLVDYSKVTLEMPIIDIYRLPDLFDAHELPRETKIAIVLPPDPKNMHKYTFFDDTANNRGYLVKLFWEKSQALVWLTSDR